jgi:hypothetical protein
MKLSEYVDNGVRDYPFWALILGSAIMILLVIGHVIRLIQSLKKPHSFFILSLGCLAAQYICATQDINTAFLTVIAEFIAIVTLEILFWIWFDSMKKHIGSCSPIISFVFFC